MPEADTFPGVTVLKEEIYSRVCISGAQALLRLKNGDIEGYT